MKIKKSLILEGGNGLGNGGQDEIVQLRDHGIDLSFTITFTERPERMDSYDWGGTNGKSQSAEWLRKKQEVR